MIIILTTNSMTYWWNSMTFLRLSMIKVISMTFQDAREPYTTVTNSFNVPERVKGWVGLVSWPTAGGRSTHINGYPSAAGQVQASESSPVRDRRSSIELHHQPKRDDQPCQRSSWIASRQLNIYDNLLHNDGELFNTKLCWHMAPARIFWRNSVQRWNWN